MIELKNALLNAFKEGLAVFSRRSWEFGRQRSDYGPAPRSRVQQTRD
jgi:hypothetical protein